jgi:hypothetical protein
MAVAVKQKGPAADSIMTPGEMKPLLALSKREPLSAAIGLTTDGDGVMLLDKKAKPKKVLAMLRADAAKAKLALDSATLRFGRAEVDTDYDSAMVRLFINKDAPGKMRVKLVEVVKRIPYQKVELNVDPTLEQEPEDGEEAHGIDTAALSRDLAALIQRIGALPESAAGLKPELIKLAGTANTALKANVLEDAARAIGELKTRLDQAAGSPPPPPPPPRPGPDAGGLARELAGLIRQISGVAGSDTGLRTRMAQLANDASGRLKANDLGGAAEAISQLRALITGTSHDDTPNEGPRHEPLLPVWTSAKDTADAQIEALRKAFLDQGRTGLRMAAEYGLSGLTDTAGVGLMVALRNFDASNGSAGVKSKVTDAVAAYRGFLSGNRLLELLEKNPLGVAVTTRATLGRALDTIETSLNS